MLRIHRVILLDLVTTLILGMVVVTSVLFGGLVLQTMGRTQGLGFSFLMTLLPPLLPVAVAFGMPYSFLISVALVYGRMASDREVVALRISGVSPRVTAMPAIALGAVLSLVSLAFNGWVLPDAAQTVRIQSRNLVDVFLGQLGEPSARSRCAGSGSPSGPTSRARAPAASARSATSSSTFASATGRSCTRCGATPSGSPATGTSS